MSFDAKAMLAKSTLKKKIKEDNPNKVKDVENAAENAGFPSRETNSRVKKKSGRPKSIFTAQFHAMLKPEDFEFIRNRAKSTGMQYGAVISELINRST